jgi:hypothetical protein
MGVIYDLYLLAVTFASTYSYTMDRIILPTKQKALQINLDSDIYGTFAEIGAGQETVRHFFRAGGASGTIAKAMSAYDKDFSDAIYGKGTDGRYVTEPRLRQMLKQEYGLMVERLDRRKFPTKRFFAFSDTLATINFAKTFKGHGWLGIRYQVEPNTEPSEIVVHIRLHENNARQQQESIGVLGVNLIYGAYFFFRDPKKLLLSLYDNLSREQIEIDMINFLGPMFDKVDNRLMSLQLVKNGMTDAVIFGPDGKNIQPSDLLYKKNILTLRGSFRPVTKVNIDMIKNGYKLFVKTKRVQKEKLQVLFEITLHNLSMDGSLDEQDFIDRADILCSLGQTVLISNYQEYYKLVEYFSRFTKARMGLIMGVNNLLEIFDESYYRDLSGGIMEAFGKLFNRDLKVFLYPYQPKRDEPLLNSKNLKVHPRLKPLYQYLLYNRRIEDIEHFDPEILEIFSPEVLRMIRENEEGWERLIPPYVDNIIKEKKLFGFNSEAKESVDSNK